MSTITLQEARTKLVEHVHGLAPGEGVTITENDRPIARLTVPLLVPNRPARPRPPVSGVPRVGIARACSSFLMTSRNRLRN